VVERKLLTTGELARALGMAPSTVQGWRRHGWVTPAFITAGGQARWIEADVREQIRALNEQRQREQDGQ
jgi:DNA-binding transcriptional MerR regulator